MKTFKQFLKEDSDSTSTIEVRELTPRELELVKDAKSLATILHAATKDKDISIEGITKLRDELRKFPQFKFLNSSIKRFDELLADHGKMMSAPEHISQNIDSIKHHTNELKKAFLSLDIKKGKVHHDELNSIIAPADRFVNAPGQAKNQIKSAFSHETSFFGSSLLLDSLGDREYEAIAALDTDKPLYTAIDFPSNRAESNERGDWHYVVYFLTNLTSVNEPRIIDNTSHFRTHIRVSLDNNPKFGRLLKIVDHYLHSNDKKLIPEIIELIEAIPIIKAANDKRKKSIKVVYRGVGFGEDEDTSEVRIERKDREAKFVATSESSYAAKNFALQKGHLDSERRSHIGYIIEYGVTPDAIMFDTKIIDTIFGESEIVIDATKAKIIDIDQV